MERPGGHWLAPSSGEIYILTYLPRTFSYSLTSTTGIQAACYFPAGEQRLRRPCSRAGSLLPFLLFYFYDFTSWLLRKAFGSQEESEKDEKKFGKDWRFVMAPFVMNVLETLSWMW